MGPTLGDAKADFAIFCEQRCFMAHKSVLEKSSSYFQGMFRFEGLVRPRKSDNPIPAKHSPGSEEQQGHHQRRVNVLNENYPRLHLH